MYIQFALSKGYYMCEHLMSCITHYSNYMYCK